MTFKVILVVPTNFATFVNSVKNDFVLAYANKRDIQIKTIGDVSTVTLLSHDAMKELKWQWCLKFEDNKEFNLKEFREFKVIEYKTDIPDQPWYA